MAERADIIDMARKAGIRADPYTVTSLVYFAELVKADAVAAEREACRIAAKNAVLNLGDDRSSGDMCAEAIDTAIRARGQKAALPSLPLRSPDCWCETCRPNTLEEQRLIVCGTCGNKRCPRATHHGHACSGSNDPGQKGSSWEHVKPAGREGGGA